MKKRVLTFLVLTAMTFVSAQNVNIPDANFKSALLTHNPRIDTNGDGQISVAEAKAFTGTIWCNNKNISDLTGIEAFVNITQLYCSNNQLNNLDLSNNTALEYLNSDNNPLRSLNLSKNTALQRLYCENNQLRSLDLSKNTALQRLYCENNQLSSLDLSNHTALEYLFCENNQLTSLDISNNTALEYLLCSNNPLISLNFKNGNISVDDLALNNNPNLRRIQVDVVE